MRQWEDHIAALDEGAEDPKLAWLETQLSLAHIPSRRHGESWHAPILQVPARHLDAAWAILDSADDVPDDDPMFGGD